MDWRKFWRFGCTIPKGTEWLVWTVKVTTQKDAEDIHELVGLSGRASIYSRFWFRSIQPR
jgi:hypothetical protein